MYLGGLNKSSISYEVYRHSFRGEDIWASCSSSDSQCNVTVEYDYYALRREENETFHISLKIEEATSMMCRGYNAPHVIHSERSNIDVNKIVGE